MARVLNTDYDVIITNNKHAYGRIVNDRFVLSIPRAFRHDKQLQERLIKRMIAKKKKRENSMTTKKQTKLHRYDETSVNLWWEKTSREDLWLHLASESEKYHFLAKTLSDYATPLIHSYAHILKRKVSAIRMRQVVSKWWSCTSDNRIMLNTDLIFLPKKYTDYIVVHECCHLVHHNHSRAFWDLVELHYPGYKTVQKELKQYSLR